MPRSALQPFTRRCAQACFSFFIIGRAKKEEEKMKVIQIHESVLQSIISDFITFGMLFSMFYLNHRFCGGSGIIDWIIAIFIFIGCVGKTSKKYTVKTAVEFLQSEEARQYIKEEKQASAQQPQVDN